MQDRKSPYKPSTPLAILGYVSVIIYLSIGLYLLIKPGVLEAYSPNVQTTIGIVLLVYGCFRLYIIIQRNKYFKKQEQNHEE